AASALSRPSVATRPLRASPSGPWPIFPIPRLAASTLSGSVSPTRPLDPAPTLSRPAVFGEVTRQSYGPVGWSLRPLSGAIALAQEAAWPGPRPRPVLAGSQPAERASRGATGNRAGGTGTLASAWLNAGVGPSQPGQGAARPGYTATGLRRTLRK